MKIWSHVAEHDPVAADRLLSRIETTLALLAEHPGIGAPRDNWRLGTRSFVVGRCILLYQSAARGIRLIRVLHGARDIAGLLSER